MGTHMSSQRCPSCGHDNLQVITTCYWIGNVCQESEWNGLCLDCGYKFWTEHGQADLDEVNEDRDNSIVSFQNQILQPDDFWLLEALPSQNNISGPKYLKQMKETRLSSGK
jgi:hypothetical protein